MNKASHTLKNGRGRGTQWSVGPGGGGGRRLIWNPGFIGSEGEVPRETKKKRNCDVNAYKSKPNIGCSRVPTEKRSEYFLKRSIERSGGGGGGGGGGV